MYYVLWWFYQIDNKLYYEIINRRNDTNLFYQLSETKNNIFCEFFRKSVYSSNLIRFAQFIFYALKKYVS